MRAGAYYNEHDPKTAAWLRELIKAGLIADGEVDERSIEDVSPDDLGGFVQCHFFAGIGGWSYALRLAGWPDDRPVWTGSCPCQPWSMAGAGKGTDDPRHLWPAWFRLWQECRPRTVFGEQTSSLDGLYWLDLVCRDVEAEDYAIWPVDISGACLGSPDIRPRLWFVADTDRALVSEQPHTWSEPLHDGVRGDVGRLGHAHGERIRRHAGADDCAQAPTPSARRETRRVHHGAESSGTARWLADAEHQIVFAGQDGQQRAHGGWSEAHGESRARGEVRGMADAHDARGRRIHGDASGHGESSGESHGDEFGAASWLAHAGGAGRAELGGRWVEPARFAAAGLLGGFWSDAEWIYCRPEPRYPEGCWRPVEPGSFPLVAGVPARILRLRGYGNSIKPYVAKEVIAAYMEIAG